MKTASAARAGRGNEGPYYRAAWAGTLVLVERVGRQAAQVQQPFLGIIGTLAGERLAPGRNRRWTADDLVEQLPVRGTRSVAGTAVEHPDDRDGTAANLGEHPGHSPATGARDEPPGATQPRVVRFNFEGEREWIRAFNGLAEEMNAERFPEHLRGTWTTLQTYLARLTLIVHYLWWASGRVGQENIPAAVGEPEVDAGNVRRAGRLIEYFKGQARRAQHHLATDPKIAGARRVLAWVERNQRERFSRQEVHHGLYGSFRTVDELKPALGVLLGNGYLQQQAGERRGRTGRKPGPLYEVNPLWARSQEAALE